MAEVLGKITFSETPDVLGSPVLLNAGGVPTILSGITSARPTAGQVGRLFLDISTNIFYRDNGTSWDNLSPIPLIDGTTNQITVVDGTNVTPSVVSITDNPVLPGTAGFVPPSGTTAQRPSSPVNGTTRFNSTLGYVEIYQNNIWSPQGRIIQVVSGTIGVSSGNSPIPWDNTTPQINEGVEIWSQSFTPMSAASTITVKFGVTVTSSTRNRIVIMTAFAGNTCIGSTAQTTPNVTDYPTNMFIDVVYIPGNTTPITFSARVGPSSSMTTYVNQTNSATLGGTMASDYIIMEVL